MAPTGQTPPQPMMAILLLKCLEQVVELVFSSLEVVAVRVHAVPLGKASGTADAPDSLGKCVANLGSVQIQVGKMVPYPATSRTGVDVKPSEPKHPRTIDSNGLHWLVAMQVRWVAVAV